MARGRIRRPAESSGATVWAERIKSDYRPRGLGHREAVLSAGAAVESAEGDNLRVPTLGVVFVGQAAMPTLWLISLSGPMSTSVGSLAARRTPAAPVVIHKS